MKKLCRNKNVGLGFFYENGKKGIEKDTTFFAKFDTKVKVCSGYFDGGRWGDTKSIFGISSIPDFSRVFCKEIHTFLLRKKIVKFSEEFF